MLSPWVEFTLIRFCRYNSSLSQFQFTPEEGDVRPQSGRAAACMYYNRSTPERTIWMATKYEVTTKKYSVGLRQKKVSLLRNENNCKKIGRSALHFILTCSPGRARWMKQKIHTASIQCWAFESRVEYEWPAFGSSAVFAFFVVFCGARHAG
jgi:hypothetical protein